MGKKKDQHAPALKKPALKSALKSAQQLITTTTAKRSNNVYFQPRSADKDARSSAEDMVSPNVS